MARYGSDHKEATRARIIASAGTRLKQDGIDGAGVATLMKDAGLTNGAFYAHFDSKNHLVAEVVATELAAQLDRLGDLPPGAAGVEQLVRGYLSLGHRDDPGHGCPSAALLDEIVRSDDGVRAAYTRGVLGFVDVVAAHLAPPAPDGSIDPRFRLAALSAYAHMVGTLQLARALTDRDLSERLVDQGVADVLRLLQDAAPPD